MHYDPYEDETQSEQTFLKLAEELEPMPEVGDHYIGAEILLLRGDKMANPCSGAESQCQRKHYGKNPYKYYTRY